MSSSSRAVTSPSVTLALVVAKGSNNVIGAQGVLPWHLSADLKFFKSLTVGCPIVMGRNTWESLPKRPLPKRENIVVSRSGNVIGKGARVFTSSNIALATAECIAASQVKKQAFVIGGAELYQEVILQVDEMFVTEVDASPAGDVFFPTFKTEGWHIEQVVEQVADSHNDHSFVINRYIRKQQANASNKKIEHE